MKMNDFIKVTVICIALAAMGTAAPLWPNWKYDQQLTGRCPYVGPSVCDPKWAFDTGDTFTIRYSAPVISSNGTVYFVSPDSFVFAVAPNGQEKWRYKTGGVPNFPALDARDRLYFSVNNMQVVALDDSVTYAKVAWTWGRADTANAGGSPVIVGSDRTVYACIDSMYALDSLGVRLWAMNRGEGSAFPPAISRDGQYLYCEYCPDPFTACLLKLNKNGTQVWSRSMGSAPGDLTWGSPAIGLDSTVYALMGSGRLHAIRPNNTDKWAPVSGLGNFLYMSPTLGLNDTLWIINRQKRPVYRKFSPGSGTKTYEDSITVSPSRYNYYNTFVTDALGQAYIMLRDSTGGANLATLYAFNSNGTVKWTHQFPAAFIRATPAIGPDSTIYVNNGHYLYAMKQSAITVEESAADQGAMHDGLVISPSLCRVNACAAIKIPAHAGISSVKIFNIAGQIVRIIPVPAGLDPVCHWDTRDSGGRVVEPGVYFCQCLGGDYQRTGKIVVVH